MARPRPQTEGDNGAWRAGAASLFAIMSEEGQQRALASWAKLGFTPALPAPPPAAPVPETSGLLADFTVLDLEFTPPAHLLELAAVRYHNWQEVDRYSSLVQFRGPVHPMVTSLTGIRSAQVFNAPAEKLVLQKFKALAAGSVLVCHNITADRRVLEAARARQGATTPLPNEWLCTLALAKQRVPAGQRCGLGELCQAFGIADHGAHRALRDVEMCYHVLRHFHKQQPVTELVTSTARPRPARQTALFTPTPL